MMDEARRLMRNRDIKDHETGVHAMVAIPCTPGKWFQWSQVPVTGGHAQAAKP